MDLERNWPECLFTEHKELTLQRISIHLHMNELGACQEWDLAIVFTLRYADKSELILRMWLK
jgi:hypothetical protein